VRLFVLAATTGADDSSVAVSEEDAAGALDVEAERM